MYVDPHPIDATKRALAYAKLTDAMQALDESIDLLGRCSASSSNSYAAARDACVTVVSALQAVKRDLENRPRD